ncbi:MAG: hypothetical protein WBG46_15295 [Nonlabens sp.]
MNSIIIYDGSFPGLFTALYDIYLLKINKPIIRSRFDQNIDLFNQEIRITTDTEKSEKVLAKLQKLIGVSRLQKLYKVFLSEDPQAENLIIQYCMIAINDDIDKLSDFGNLVVSRIEKIVKMVGREPSHESVHPFQGN